MASHLEVFKESFTAKQRIDWSMTSFLILNVLFVCFLSKIFPFNVLEGENASENERYIHHQQGEPSHHFD